MMLPKLLNRPVRVQWAGWETDTYQLGCAGWEISAQQDIHYNSMRIAINHPTIRVQGISNVDTFMFQDMMEGRCNPVLPVVLRFETMQHVVNVQSMKSPGIDFYAVDHMPRMVEQQIESLNDFANFGTAREMPKHEVYLHEANMNQILEMALQQQEPEQERIRSEIIRSQELRQLRLGTLHTELRMVA